MLTAYGVRFGSREDGHRGRLSSTRTSSSWWCRVRPEARHRGRCGRCRRRVRGYDRGRGERRWWRALDLGTIRTWLVADSVRVECPEHGVVVAHVPWARHDAGHTLAFDDQVAWLATRRRRPRSRELMRIAWRTVGAIVARVWADADALVDRFDGLRRIGIDEISYRRGQLFLMVVIDHDTGRLVWAAPGQNTATLQGFFDALGLERCAQITHVSADGAEWIAKAVVARTAPKAIRGADPFHVVKWANEALAEVRTQAWRDAAGVGPRDRTQTRPRQTTQGRGAAPGQRTRQGPDGRPLRAMEEPREPHRPTAAPNWNGSPGHRPPALPGLPTQGRPATDLPATLRGSRRGPRPVDQLGPTLPDPRIRRNSSAPSPPRRKRSSPRSG